MTGSFEILMLEYFYFVIFIVRGHMAIRIRDNKNPPLFADCDVNLLSSGEKRELSSISNRFMQV